MNGYDRGTEVGTATLDRPALRLAPEIDLRGPGGRRPRARVGGSAEGPVFDSRTRIVRRRTLEPIEGLPIESQVLANDNGLALGAIMQHTGQARTVERYVSSSESLGTLPEHSLADALGVEPGRVTAKALLTHLDWQNGQHLWADQSPEGCWELSPLEPANNYRLVATVAPRGRLTLDRATRNAIGIKPGTTVLALATTKKTLALIPLGELAVRNSQ